MLSFWSIGSPSSDIYPGGGVSVLGMLPTDPMLTFVESMMVVFPGICWFNVASMYGMCCCCCCWSCCCCCKLNAMEYKTDRMLKPCSIFGSGTSNASLAYSPNWFGYCCEMESLALPPKLPPTTTAELDEWPLLRVPNCCCDWGKFFGTNT